MMSWYRDGGMEGYSILYMALVWVTLIAAGLFIVRWLTQREKGTQNVETPRQILDRRYANGEIDQTEYAMSRRLIEGHRVETEKSK